MSAALETFVCRPLTTKLTRTSCASRSTRAGNEAAGRGTGGHAHLIANDCVACPIGAAHRAGGTPVAWPDGTPLELVTITLPTPGSQALTGKPLPPTSEERARASRHLSLIPSRGTGTSERALREPEDETRDGMPKGKLYEHEGEQKTAGQWANDPRNVSGCDRDAFTYRLINGWSVHDALTAPKGSRQGPRPSADAKPRRRSAKKAAGQALRELFDGAPATPPKARVQREPKPDRSAPATHATGHGATLDAIIAEVARLEAALPDLRAGANALAHLHGLPTPYPEAHR